MLKRIGRSKVKGKGRLPKFKERKIDINIEPYPYTLHLIVSNDVVKSAANQKKNIGYIAVKNNAAAFTITCQSNPHIWVFLPERVGLGITAHEMLHVVAFVMEDIGAEFEEEVWAYHLGDLTQKAAEFVHKEDKRFDKDGFRVVKSKND